MQAWFDQQTAGMIGGIIGCLGGGMGALFGCTANYCVTRGKKKWVYGIMAVAISIGAVFSVLGLIALLAKQPYHVWYPFVLSGFLMTILFSCFLPMMRNRFIQNEMRQMSAKDL